MGETSQGMASRGPASVPWFVLAWSVIDMLLAVRGPTRLLAAQASDHSLTSGPHLLAPLVLAHEKTPWPIRRRRFGANAMWRSPSGKEQLRAHRRVHSPTMLTGARGRRQGHRSSLLHRRSDPFEVAGQVPVG